MNTPLLLILIPSLLHHQEVGQRWSEYQTRFSSLVHWSRQHTALMANKSFPQNPVELKVSVPPSYVHHEPSLNLMVSDINRRRDRDRTRMMRRGDLDT